jgi:hypothetical protein
MEEPIEAPPVPVDPPWVAAAMAAAPPHPPEVQAVLDEQNQGDAPKVARNFRMAYAATVTLHDAEGESIHTIRYGRMPKGDVRGLCRGLARDVTAMRAQRPELKVAYLTDGASEFETLYRAWGDRDRRWFEDRGVRAGERVAIVQIYREMHGVGLPWPGEVAYSIALTGGGPDSG